MTCKAKTYGAEGSHPPEVISQDSEHRFVTDAQIEQWTNGTAGQGQYMAMMFRRSATVPDTPEGGSFSFPIPNGGQWTNTILPGIDPVFISTRFFTSDGKAPQQAVWSPPVLFVQHGSIGPTGPKGDQGTPGIQGPPGNDGLNGADGVSGADGTSIIWLGEASSHPLEAVNGHAYKNTTNRKSYVFQDGAWYQMTIDGVDGLSGYSNAIVTLYQAAPAGAPEPASFTGTFTYDFASGLLSGGTLNGWSQQLPSVNQGEVLWARQASAASSQTIDTIKATEFSAGTVITSSGTDGLNSATVALYQKNTSASVPPSMPSGDFSYSFLSHVLSGGILNGWAQSVPHIATGEYLWMIQATASSTGTADSIAHTEFSAPVAISASGNDGLSIEWKGDLTLPPANPVKNWAYRDTDNGIVYLYNGSAWEMMVLDGNDGVDGAPGIDGYTPVKGVDYFDGINGQDGADGDSAYQIWLNDGNSGTTTDFINALRGADGVDGSDGLPGTPGADGITYYTWIKYADSADGSIGFSNVPADKPYIGFAFNKTTAIESENPADYAWSLIQGADGLSVYIVYHDASAAGTPPSVPTTPAGTDNGWYTTPTTNSNWMSQKVDDGTTANWGAAIKIKGVDGAPGADGLNGADGVDGADGVSIVWKGSFSSHPIGAENGWAYRNTVDKKSYVYQSGAWYQMTIDGIDGQAGISIVWKGGLTSAPLNPQTNWVYKNTTDGVIYIYNGASWEMMVLDGNDGVDGAKGENGLSVSIVYHDAPADGPAPASPTTVNGISGGWYSAPTNSSNWMSQKVDQGTTNAWGAAIRIGAVNGTNGISIVWKGDLATAPTNPQLNWAYRDTTNKRVYIYNGTAWKLMTLDGNDGAAGANGADGLSVYITYHDADPQGIPPVPPTNVQGTNNGWHTNATSKVGWMSQKVDDGTGNGWGLAIPIRGANGATGPRGSSIFTIEESDAASIYVTEAVVASWVGTLNNANAQNVARDIIGVPPGSGYSADGWIRPNDKITVTDASKRLSGTRVYIGMPTQNHTTVLASHFTNIITEVIDGNLLVNGSVSVNALGADIVSAGKIRGDLLKVTNAEITGQIRSDGVGATGLPMWEINKDSSLILRAADGSVILQSGGTLSKDFITGLGNLSTLNGFTVANITSFFETAAIGEALLSNAAVSTLKIQNNAVTVPVGAYTAGNIEIGTSWVTIQQATIDALGQPVSINYATAYHLVWTSTGYVTAELYCRLVYSTGTEIIPEYQVERQFASSSVTLRGTVSFSTMIFPAEPVTVYLQLRVNTTSNLSATTRNAFCRYLGLIGMKR